MHAASQSPSSSAVAERPPWFVRRGGTLPGTTAHAMGEVMALLGLPVEPWAQACAVRMTHVRAHTPFHGEGDVLRALYVVRHGAFKCVRLSEDGYEHVLGFAWQADLLGLDGLVGGRHPLSLMALEDASVFVLPLPELAAWRRQSAVLDRELMRALSLQLTRAREVAIMMSAVASEARLARFLVWLAGRVASGGGPASRFLLRMSRRDIASLLGIAHETVSRGFSLLSEWGYVKVDNRDVEILDMPGLLACTRATRRDSDELRPAALLRRPPAPERRLPSVAGG